MMLYLDDEIAVVSCGDTSTTVRYDLTNGFAIVASETDWEGDTPVEWGEALSGRLPVFQQIRLSTLSESDLELALYGLAHSTESEPESFAELVEFWTR